MGLNQRRRKNVARREGIRKRNKFVGMDRARSHGQEGRAAGLGKAKKGGQAWATQWAFVAVLPRLSVDQAT
jgi:hypothetical protein